MIDRKSLLSLNFYKSSPFTGSDGDLRYRIEKITLPDDGSEEPQIRLQVTSWFGPFAFAHTPDEKKTTYLAAFSEEGLLNITQWLNEQHP